MKVKGNIVKNINLQFIFKYFPLIMILDDALIDHKNPKWYSMVTKLRISGPNK